MLYVFHVDAGQMTTYDMNLTLQSVKILKSAIEKKTKVPANGLVLLVSGGEVLQPDHMVSSYSAGTDTNPIYMFTKPSINESHLKQSIGVDLSPMVELSTGEFRSDSRSAYDGKSITELKMAVEMCCSLPPTVHTVISCATLAQQFKDYAHEVSRNCEQLVHEQHLQHQGWAAVVANLEDIYNEFCERSKIFKECFRKHRQKRESYDEQLKAFRTVLDSLEKIPILPELIRQSESQRFSAFDGLQEADFDYKYNKSLDDSDKRSQDFGVEPFKMSDEDVFGNASKAEESQYVEAEPSVQDSNESVTFRARSSSKDNHSLLQWILAQGNNASLHDILDYCQKGFKLIDTEPWRENESQLYRILEYANMHGLKQIKGIEDRLYGLDQLLSDIKKLERDQHDQAASLTQYRERLHAACDPSVLPTLLQSHCCQLEKLLRGHQELLDIRRRIAMSKNELSQILKARLEAVLKIQNSMSILDAHAMLSYQCFNRLSRYLEIVSQLHRAPVVYVRAVHEVARRRTFSNAHLMWTTDLAAKLSKIHEEEVARRQEFNTLFAGHFLRNLFPGLLDLPPQFATQGPPVFDAKLPRLTDDDVRYITDTLPQFADVLPNYNMDSVLKFFNQRLYTPDYEEKDVDVQVNFEKDIESETDIGDFEKLSDQILQKERVDTSITCVPDTMAVSTVTEDNMEFQKLRVERLQDYLIKMYDSFKEKISLMKQEMRDIKYGVIEQQKIFECLCAQILVKWAENDNENYFKYREQTQRLTVDHELELSDMKALLNEKDEVIDSLNKDKEDLRKEHQKHVEILEAEHQKTKSDLRNKLDDIKLLEAKLEEAEIMKQKDIKDLQDKMHLDYKAEIESLRSRFRLVALTNMDRSPSESSLEKIERTDVIEINSHNAIIRQTKENAEVEKDEAVKEAIKNAEIDWKKKLDDEMNMLRSKYESEKHVTINDATRRLLAEKDRQLEMLREREQTLSRECIKYRGTIQQLTDPETNDIDALLRCQLGTLENQKALLEQEVQDLNKQLAKKVEDENKIKEDEITWRSTKREERKIRPRSHTPYGLSAGTINLTSCLPGNIVLILWDQAHLNYTVLQEAPIMYFVNSDCLPSLGLSINVENEEERRLYALAVVESKDYCYAKKNGNRYRMPNGCRFYRVRVKPMRSVLPPPPCCDQRHKHDSQKSVDTSQSISSHTDESTKVAEVVTGTLINLDSPVSNSEAASSSSIAPPQSEDQLDSIETSEQWHNAKMNMSTASIFTDMECSVGQCKEPGPEPLELTVSAVSVVARGSVPPGSEIAEEASP